jgi:predicted DNA-binding transcriptional regulator AlpA
MQTVVETIASNTKLITVAYLSDVSGIPRKTLYKHVKSGSLPSYQIGGAIWIEPRDAAKWFRDHSTQN